MRIGNRFLVGLLLTGLLSAGSYFHLTQIPEHLSARLIAPFVKSYEEQNGLYLQISLPPAKISEREINSSYLAGILPLLAEFDAARLFVTLPVVSFPSPAATAALRMKIRSLLLLEQAQRDGSLSTADMAMLTDALALAELSLQGWDGALTRSLEWFPEVFSIPPVTDTDTGLLPRSELSAGAADWGGSRWRRKNDPGLYLIPAVPAAAPAEMPDSRLLELLAAEARLVAWTAEFQSRHYIREKSQRSDLLTPYRAAEELVTRGLSYDPRYRLFRETFLSSLAALLTSQHLDEIKKLIAESEIDNSESLAELAEQDFSAGRSLLREYRQLRTDMAEILKNRIIVLGRDDTLPGLPSRQGAVIGVLQMRVGAPLRFLPGWIRAAAAGMLLVLIPLFAGGHRRLMLLLAPVVVIICIAVSLLLARYTGLFYPIVSSSLIVLLYYVTLSARAGRKIESRETPSGPEKITLILATGVPLASLEKLFKDIPGTGGGEHDGIVWLRVPITGIFFGEALLRLQDSPLSSQTQAAAEFGIVEAREKEFPGSDIYRRTMHLLRFSRVHGNGVYSFGKFVSEFPPAMLYREIGYLRVPGGNAPLRVVELIAPSDPRREMIPDFSEGFRLYGLGQYRESLRYFQRCMAKGEDRSAAYYAGLIKRKLSGAGNK